MARSKYLGISGTNDRDPRSLDITKERNDLDEKTGQTMRIIMFCKKRPATVEHFSNC